ncbi:hypothetical protein HC256_002819 [Beauveria bassiana]|nr:hypothetical protein HC256_002819 [Beauveria bassiana]
MSVLVVLSDDVGVTLESSDEVTKEPVSDCDRLVELLVSDVEPWRDVSVTDSVLEVELELAEIVDYVDVDPEVASVDEVNVGFGSDERVDPETDSMLLLPDAVVDWGSSGLEVVCEESDDEDGKVAESVSDELGVGIAFELDWTVLEVATEVGVELKGVEVDSRGDDDTELLTGVELDSGETVDRLWVWDDDGDIVIEVELGSRVEEMAGEDGIVDANGELLTDGEIGGEDVAGDEGTSSEFEEPPIGVGLGSEAVEVTEDTLIGVEEEEELTDGEIGGEDVAGDEGASSEVEEPPIGVGLSSEAVEMTEDTLIGVEEEEEEEEEETSDAMEVVGVGAGSFSVEEGTGAVVG